MAYMTTKQWNMCHDKQGYNDPRQAYDVACRQAREEGCDNLYSYPCPYCGKYHVGHLEPGTASTHGVKAIRR